MIEIILYLLRLRYYLILFVHLLAETDAGANVTMMDFEEAEGLLVDEGEGETQPAEEDSSSSAPALSATGGAADGAAATAVVIGSCSMYVHTCMHAVQVCN